ncbi:MAG: hypothetical protein AAF519_17420 [Bacteroidota bacterium]
MERYLANIKQIEWIDKEGAEAEVLFEINGKWLWAFCHPCDFTQDTIKEVYFSFIEEEIPESTFWDENREQKKEIVPSENDKWRYYCYGQLKNIHPVMIDCGTITFSFGDRINDERTVGSYVYFVMSRLDIGKV